MSDSNPPNEEERGSTTRPSEGGRGNNDNNETANGTFSDNGSTQQDIDVGAGGGRLSSSYLMEGYTPLNFNMNAMAMAEEDGNINEDSDSNMSDNGNNNDDMDGDVFASGGYYHMMGAPPKRLNGVKDKDEVSGVTPASSLLRHTARIY